MKMVLVRTEMVWQGKRTYGKIRAGYLTKLYGYGRELKTKCDNKSCADSIMTKNTTR